jgi:hypothetical protein
MTFLGNPSNESRVDTYGETDRREDGRTDEWTDAEREMTKLYAFFSQIMRTRQKRDKCGEFNSVIHEKSKISFLHREDVSRKFSEILIYFYQTTFNAV